MKHPWEKLLPPPGGVEGLRSKLDALENQRTLFRGPEPARLAAITMTASLMLAIGYNFLPTGLPSSQTYGIFQRYMEAPTAEIVSLTGPEAARLRLVQQDSGNPAVRLYWIEDVDD